MPETNRPPSALNDSGRRLWDSVVSVFDLEEHETALFLEACRTLDLLDELDGIVRAQGAIVQSPQGPKAHPAVTEARQQKIALARILAALRLPAGEDGDHQASARPQRRVGARGVYGINGGKAS